MVNIRTPENTNNNITVSSPNTNNAVNTLNSVVFSEDLAQQWAVKLDGKVKNEDYSSKYYALQAKQTVDNLELDAKAINELKPQLLEDFENYSASLASTKENALNEISNTTELSVVGINSASTVAIGDINAVAKEQTELVASTANKALEDIEILATNSSQTLESLSATSVQEINTAKTTALSQITTEGAEQIANIESTGFYMRDDKLYFINSEGVETEFESGSGSGFNLFDTKVSDHILEGEESLGWALQGTYVYKEGVAGSRTGYADFYNRCLEEYENATEKGYLSANVDIVGSLTDTQGVLSGFSDSANYATLPTVFNPETNIWEAVFKFTTGTDVTTVQNIFSSMSGVDGKYSGFMLQVHNGGLVLKGSTNGTSWNINLTGGTVNANSTYWIKGEFTGNAYNLYISTNGSTFQLINTASSTAPFTNIAVSRIGVYGNKASNPFKGSIDLKESYINMNGVRWWDGAVTIQKNTNGHIFYDISQKPYIDSIYESTGIADYYGIDLVNERIFLPRNKYFAVTGAVAVAGNGITVGLQGQSNNTLGGLCYEAGQADLNYDSGAYGLEAGSSYTVKGCGASNFTVGLTPDSTKSGIEGQLTPNENKYLYYCAGNTKVESAISNVTEITTSENDTLPLFYNFYSNEDMTTTGAYVNASLGSWLSGNVYTTAYNELVNKLGTDNVKANTDTYTDYDFVVNQDDMTFRLPIKNGQEIMFATGVKGNGKTLGLTDGVDTWSLSRSGGSADTNLSYRTYHSENLPITDTTSNPSLAQNKLLGITSDSTKSGIELDTENITIPDGWNLYYKLSNAVTNLELLDVANVTAELNTCYKRNTGDNSDLSGLAMPSNRYIDLTLGATGTIYTAPASGWFYLSRTSTGASQYISLVSQVATNKISTGSGQLLQDYIPVLRGHTVNVTYNAPTASAFKFYYAEGEV